MEKLTRYEEVCPNCNGTPENLPVQFCGDHYCSGHERCYVCFDRGTVLTQEGKDIQHIMRRYR